MKQYKNLIKFKNKSLENFKLINELYVYVIKKIKDQHSVFELQSIGKGNNNLVIQRKGKATSKSEIIKFIFNGTCIGKKIKSLTIKEVKTIKKNPINYVKNYNNLVNEFNTYLKFDLINFTNFKKLKIFKSDCVLRVFIPESSSNFKVLGIATLKDRYVQKFMQIIIVN